MSRSLNKYLEIEISASCVCATMSSLSGRLSPSVFSFAVAQRSHIVVLFLSSRLVFLFTFFFSSSGCFTLSSLLRARVLCSKCARRWCGLHFCRVCSFRGFQITASRRICHSLPPRRRRLRRLLSTPRLSPDSSVCVPIFVRHFSRLLRDMATAAAAAFGRLGWAAPWMHTSRGRDARRRRDCRRRRARSTRLDCLICRAKGVRCGVSRGDHSSPWSFLCRKTALSECRRRQKEILSDCSPSNRAQSLLPCESLRLSAYRFRFDVVEGVM